MATKNHGGRRKGAGPPTKMEKETKTTFYQENAHYKEMQRRYGRNWQQVARDLIAAHLASEAEAKQPIRGHLLLEAGWTRGEYNGGTVYNKEFYNEREESGYVYVDFTSTCTDAYLVIYYTSDGKNVRIPMPNIETMADLNQLLKGLKDD